MNNKKFSVIIKNLINFLLCIFPASFILGNFAINLEIFLICVLGIILYRQEVFKINKDFALLLTIFFFLQVIISTLIDFYNENNSSNILRSFLYLRYLIFLLVLNCLIKNKDFNFKYFLFSCLFWPTLVSIDIIYQYINGKNFFGFLSHPYSNSGFFGEERVAGGYIQRFACLGIFFIPLFFKHSKEKLFFVSTIIICFSGMLLSGNRMPLILILMYGALIIIFIKELRFTTIISGFLGLLVFTFIINTNYIFKENFKSFYLNSKTIIPRITEELNRKYPELEKGKDENLNRNFVDTNVKGKGKDYNPVVKEKYKIIYSRGSHHGIVFLTSIDTWKNRPVLGGGIKSFREKCKETLHRPNRMCQHHSHNYYLDILNDTGLVGLFLLLGSLYLITIKKFKFFKKKLMNIKYFNFIFYPIIFSLILEFFPIRSAGGFFSTSNSSFIFMLLGIFWGLYNLKSKKVF